MLQMCMLMNWKHRQPHIVHVFVFMHPSRRVFFVANENDFHFDLVFGRFIVVRSLTDVRVISVTQYRIHVLCSTIRHRTFTVALSDRSRLCSYFSPFISVLIDNNFPKPKSMYSFFLLEIAKPNRNSVCNTLIFPVRNLFTVSCCRVVIISGW